MSSKRNLVISGAIAAIIAIALVTGVVTLGVLPSVTSTVASTHTFTSSPVASNGQSSTLSTTSSISAQVQTISSTSSTSPSVTLEPGSSSGESGNLAILMTDPPTVPAGVTAVYVTYVNLGIHVSGDSNDTGWHILDSQGQIDLMGIINSTQTVAAANVTQGTFNALAFNVTSAVVTFDGSNYTADLVYGDHILFVPIVGGIKVVAGQPSAAVIDVTPTVLLLGNTTSPTFAFIPTARAYTVPAQSVSLLHLRVGGKDNIQNAPWWVAILQMAKYEITGVTLTPTSLSISVANTGNASVVFRIAALASTTTESGGNIPVANIYTILAMGEAFVVEGNGSLVPIVNVGNGAATQMIAAGGYILAPGESATFTYSGNVTLGAALVNHPLLHRPVLSGERYVVGLLGSAMVAETAVTAST